MRVSENPDELMCFLMKVVVASGSQFSRVASMLGGNVILNPNYGYHYMQPCDATVQRISLLLLMFRLCSRGSHSNSNRSVQRVY